MSNTSNFDHCVQTSIGVVREIFHLAFKNEELFPHNPGPFDRVIGGHAATVKVVVLDDQTRPADLAFEDEKHIRFRIPTDITVEMPDAPDPALTRITMQSTASLLGRLDSWADAAGEPVLGIDFGDISAGGVTVEGLSGLPTVGAPEMTRAIHSKYTSPGFQHRYSTPAPGGTGWLNIYDGIRDASLLPPNPGAPDITAVLESHDGLEYVKVVVPIHVEVPTGFGAYVYSSFGTITFWRPVSRSSTTVTVAMGSEPAAAALATAVALTNTGPGQAEVTAQLRPLAINAVASFGTLSEPAYSQAAAEATIQDEIAAYLRPIRFGLFTPRSTEAGVVLTTPVGFLLVPTETLAILMTRRHGSASDDVAPNDFRGTHDVALATGREVIVEKSDAIIAARFPGINGTGGGYEFHRSEGDATLRTCHAAPEGDGAHGKSPGHLWVTGDAEVHIDCWPDPDVSFSGPVFIDATPHAEGDEGCWLELQPRAGDFDVGQSCCDVLVDILIPVVGWIMLAVVESLIDEVGGAIAQETATSETQMLQPLPKVVIGIAEVTCCLETIVITDEGFVFPGSMTVRRDGRSFEDLHDSGSAPRPDSP